MVLAALAVLVELAGLTAPVVQPAPMTRRVAAATDNIPYQTLMFTAPVVFLARRD
jgi:hypothetical protein